MRCSRCEALTVNNVFCHETGCPNQKKTWIEDRQDWIRFWECPECGDDIEEGECCDCMIDEGLENEEDADYEEDNE